MGGSALIHTRLSVDPGAMLEWMGACKKQTTLPAEATAGSASHNKATCFAFAAFPCAFSCAALISAIREVHNLTKQTFVVFRSPTLHATILEPIPRALFRAIFR